MVAHSGARNWPEELVPLPSERSSSRSYERCLPASYTVQCTGWRSVETVFVQREDALSRRVSAKLYKSKQVSRFEASTLHTSLLRLSAQAVLAICL
jgi:hypothetical protein